MTIQTDGDRSIFLLFKYGKTSHYWNCNICSINAL